MKLWKHVNQKLATEMLIKAQLFCFASLSCENVCWNVEKIPSSSEFSVVFPWSIAKTNFTQESLVFRRCLFNNVCMKQEKQLASFHKFWSSKRCTNLRFWVGFRDKNLRWCWTNIMSKSFFYQIQGFAWLIFVTPK